MHDMESGHLASPLLGVFVNFVDNDILNLHLYLFWNIQCTISSFSHITIYAVRALYIWTAGLCAVNLKHARKAHTSLPIHGWANRRSKFSWYQLLRVRWLQKHFYSCCLMIGWHAGVTLVSLIPSLVSDTQIEATVALPLLITIGSDSGKMTYLRS